LGKRKQEFAGKANKGPAEKAAIAENSWKYLS
jgi:hypothetical protein